MRTSFFALLTAAMIVAGGMPARSAVATTNDNAPVHSAAQAGNGPVRVAIMVCGGNSGCYRPQVQSPKHRKFQPLGH